MALERLQASGKVKPTRRKNLLRVTHPNCDAFSAPRSRRHGHSSPTGAILSPPHPMRLKITPAFVRACAALCLCSGLNSLLAADATPAPAATPAAAATPPAAGAPDTAAPGRRGGGGGGRAPAPPLTDEDKVQIARAAAFPAWAPGAGDGNYSIGPDYANAPEMTPRDGVPKGRVETF